MAGDIKLTMSADDAKVLASIKKQLREYKNVTGEVKKTSEEKKKGRRVADGIAGSVGKIAAGWVSVTSVLSIANQMLQTHEQTQQRILAAQREQFQGLGSLAQLAGGDAGRLRELRTQAETVSRTTGLNIQQAGQFVFNATSQGISPEQQLQIAPLANADLDIGAVATAVGTLQASTGPGDALNITSQLIAAAEKSPVSTTEFLPGIAAGAPGAGRVGTGRPELLSLLAVLAKTAGGSASQAGTQLNALAKVIQAKELGGEGILAALPRIQEQIAGLSGAEQLAFFGRQEGFNAFTALQDPSNIAEVRAILGEVEGSAGLAQSIIGSTEDVFGGQIDLRRSEAAAAVVEAREGGSLAQRNAVFDALVRQARARGDVGVLDELNLLGHRGARLFGVDLLSRVEDAGSLSDPILRTLQDILQENRQTSNNTEPGLNLSGQSE